MALEKSPTGFDNNFPSPKDLQDLKKRLEIAQNGLTTVQGALKTLGSNTLDKPLTEGPGGCHSRFGLWLCPAAVCVCASSPAQDPDSAEKIAKIRKALGLRA